MSLPPSVSYALTLDEVTEELARAEDSVDACEQAVTDAQAALAMSMRESYKSGDADAGKVWELILDSDSMEALITATEYVTSLSRKQGQVIDDAKHALWELTGERERLASLQSEEQGRIAAQENRDSGKYHFCQWGESWSGLPYWGGGSIGADGCGLCSYTTMVNLLTGSDYDPAGMLALRGDWAGQEEKVDWTNGTPDGTTHAEWTKRTFDIDLTQIEVSVASCRQALNESETVLIVGPEGTTMHDRYGNTRWTNGHYVCVYRCDDSGFYMHDSAYSGDAGTAVYYTDAEFADIISTTPIVLKCSN